MFEITFLLFFCVLAWSSNKGVALATLIASLILFPEYIRFDIFVMKMSIARIVALIIILKWWYKSRININFYDKSVVIYWVLYILMATLSGGDQTYLIYVIGRVMDTVLFYFVARVCLTDQDDFNKFFKFFAIVAISVSLLAIFESYLADSIYRHLRSANTWMWNDKLYEERLLGFVRAYGSTLNPIYWGMSMLLMFIILTSLSVIAKGKKSSVYLFITAAGVFSSLSSGPIMGLILFFILNKVGKSKRVFVNLLFLLLVAIFIIEVFSNRHFYDMAQYLTLNSATAWYRSKLIEVALKNYSIYIISGVGGVWPHHWGALIDGRAIVDVVNQYIVVALNGGLVLLVLYLYIFFKPVKDFVTTWQAGSSLFLEVNRLLVMGLLAIAVTGFTVAFYNPVENLIFLLLGILRQAAIVEKNIRRVEGEQC